MKAVGAVLSIAAIFTGNPWVALAAMAANGIAAQQERRKAERAARDAYNASLHDRMIMVRGTVEPRELVLGRVRKSGQLYPIGSIGTNNEKFVFVVLLAGHEIDAVEQVWFNETPLTLDSSGYVQTAPYIKGEILTDSLYATVSGNTVTLPRVPIVGSVHATQYDDATQTENAVTPSNVSGAVVTISIAGACRINYQYSLGTSRARVTWSLGTSTQAASARLLALFPSKWTSAHQLLGIAYLVVELDYDQDAYPTGLPVVSAVIRGAKVYDPSSTTTAWSENPALLLRAAATHPLCGRLPTAYIDDAAISAAATVADTSTAYVVAGVGTTTRARYTAGTVIRSDQQPQQGITELLSAMSGRMSFAGGKLRIKTGYTAPVAAIDADWFAPGPVQYTPSVPRQDLNNVVQGTYVDGGGKWQVVPFTRQVDSASVSSDGAELAQDLTLGAVTFGPQAQQVAANLLRESRNSATFAATFNLRAYALEALDTVTLTLDRFGLAAKAFEIIERAYTADAGITLTLRETDASFYALGSSFVQPASTANTTLPQPWNVAAPGALDVQSGTAHLLRQSDGTVVSRMWVSWPAITDAAVLAGGQVEVAYTLGNSTLPAGSWSSVTVPGDAPGAYITTVQDGRVYLVKARCINATPVRSPWGTQVVHRVIGKSAAPAQVADLTATVVQGGVRVSWTPSAELDYADTDLRIGAYWSSAAALFRGTSNTYTWPWPAAGTYTLSAKHRDTTGNVSAAAATVAVTVDAAMLVQWANIAGTGRPADSATVGPALNADPYMLNPMAWAIFYGVAATFAAISDGKVGTGVARSGAAGTLTWGNGTQHLAVDAAKTYRVSGWLRTVSGSGSVAYLGAALFDSAGSNITGAGSQWYYAAASVAPGGSWSFYSGLFGAGTARPFPSTARTMAPLYILSYGGGTSVHEIQDLRIEEVTEVVSAQAAADAAALAAASAQTAAGNAQTSANTANTALTNIASDSILSPSEKPSVVQDYTVITGEQSGIDAQATAYGISTEKTTYDSAVSALTTYLGTLSGWNTVPGSDVAIVGTTFRANFAGVYTARQALLNKVSEIAGTRAVWAAIASKPVDTDLLNTHTQGSILVVNHPAGGNYSNAAAGQTGALKIRLPQSWTNTMLRFFVEVYEYVPDRSFTLEIGGYNSSTPGWLNCYARMTGAAVAEKTVRFGHDGTYCCIWIGDPAMTWEFPQVAISNFRAAYSNFAQATWASGWQVSLDTSAVAGHAVNYTQANPLTGASWAQIPAGTGKAADYATVNRLSYSSSAPGSPVDGDLWVDTTTVPYVIKLRESSLWRVGANLSTGTLAQLNAVDTAQIAANATTDVVSVTTAGPITLTVAYAELIRVSFGPYAYATYVMVQFYAEALMIQASGPTNMGEFFYAEDNTTAQSPVLRVGAGQGTTLGERATPTITYNFTLAASTSGFVKIMGKANDDSTYQTDTVRGLYILAEVAKR